MRLKQLLLVIAFSFVAIIGLAQPNPQNPNQDPDIVPITGLEYLLLGGGLYGVSKFLKNRKNKHNQS